MQTELTFPVRKTKFHGDSCEAGLESNQKELNKLESGMAVQAYKHSSREAEGGRLPWLYSEFRAMPQSSETPSQKRMK